MSRQVVNKTQVSGLPVVNAGSAGSLIAAMHQGEGPSSTLEVPKPFSQPICLVPDTRVAGTRHVDRIDVLAEALCEGDRLQLQRDTRNPYDQWAIKVFDGDGERLGFVAADVNEVLARLMDGGKYLYAQVTRVELVGMWWKIGMAVWLDD